MQPPLSSAQSRAKLELEDAQSEKLNHQLPQFYLLLVEGETLNPPGSPARRAARGGWACAVGDSCSVGPQLLPHGAYLRLAFTVRVACRTPRASDTGD
jgi:hypothetical protein